MKLGKLRLFTILVILQDNITQLWWFMHIINFNYVFFVRIWKKQPWKHCFVQFICLFWYWLDFLKKIPSFLKKLSLLAQEVPKARTVFFWRKMHRLSIKKLSYVLKTTLLRIAFFLGKGYIFFRIWENNKYWISRWGSLNPEK